MLIRRAVNMLRHRWSTEGGYRELATLAVPLILMTSTWTIQQFINRVFLTWYSPETLAAAMPAGMLNFAIMSFFVGTVGYVETFVAQYYGAGRPDRIGPSFWQGIYVAIIGGLVLLAFVPFAGAIYRFAGHPAAVQRHEVIYFRILCLGAMPALACTAMGAFFSGRGKVWPVMWVSILGCCVNVALDYLLIFGHFGFPELGIKGAGIATVTSGVVQFVAYFILIAKPSNEREFRTMSGWRLDSALLGRLLRFGSPSGAQFLVDMSAFAAFILLVGRLGETSMAATSIAFNINMLAFMPMLGIGFSVSILVGQYVGRNRPDVAQKAAYSGFQVAIVYVVIIAAAYVLLPGMFLAPYGVKASPESFAPIRALAVVLLRFVAAYCLFDTLNIIFSSAIKGAGDTRFVMFMLVIMSALGLVLPTFVAVVVLHAGIYATWTIATIYYSLLGVAFFLRFLGGKWKSMRVIESAPMNNGNASDLSDLSDRSDLSSETK